MLLVDDHPMVVEGIRQMLLPETDLRVVAQANGGEQALELLSAHPEVRVVLLDLSMPGMSGVELARAIRAGWAEVRVLALSMFHDHATVAEVLEAGGAGYVLKTASRAELSTAIRQVAAGRTYFSQDVADTLLQNLQITASLETPGPPAITRREREILQLIAREHSNLEIAEALFISERTVETHRRNLLTKTKCKSAVGLIQYAIRHNLLA
ncbi:two component transcriptional regulator, LuxR family [Hymenobacter actinosclerus]|uniref:Two component transcriptional regulator, LuxR family n=1 Tax=Hymenobacter actinosclerus TaxID=82805 RepID=A0A1I0GJ41_9BACT|nr:two component transcriptional regulator, LuxR family [Hymenobacter actinosclerus]